MSLHSIVQASQIDVNLFKTSFSLMYAGRSSAMSQLCCRNSRKSELAIRSRIAIDSFSVSLISVFFFVSFVSVRSCYTQTPLMVTAINAFRLSC